MQNNNFLTKSRWLVTIILLLSLGIGNAWGASYSGTVAKVSSNGDQTMGTVTWTITASNTSGLGQNVDGTKGAQIGTARQPVSSLTFETSGISGVITNVTVTTSGASSVSATVGVQVGSTNFKYNNTNNTTTSISATSTAYPFNGSASGTITISWSQSSSKALYVKSITVTYYPRTTITLSKNGGTANGEVKYDHNESSYVTSSFSAATNSSSYTCTGYYTATSGGTKILNANGTLAAASITNYTNSSTQWIYDGASLTLHAQWESAAACTATPSVGAASLNGSFTCSTHFMLIYSHYVKDRLPLSRHGTLGCDQTP